MPKIRTAVAQFTEIYLFRLDLCPTLPAPVFLLRGSFNHSFSHLHQRTLGQGGYDTSQKQGFSKSGNLHIVPEYARCLHERSWVTLLCMQCTKPYMQPVGNFFSRETASSMNVIPMVNHQLYLIHIVCLFYLQSYHPLLTCLSFLESSAKVIR